MRKIKLQQLFLSTIALTLAIGLSNCQVKQEPETKEVNNSSPAAGVLVYGSGGQPVSLEPGNIIDGNSLIVQRQIYNRLIDFKPGTTELQAGLTSKWSASADGKIWTLQLRPGIKFHDGTDFDAAAVKFNLERWWDANNPYGYRDAGKNYKIWSDLFGGFRGEPDSLVQDIVVEERYQIKFVLKNAFAAFPAALASGYFGIASPAAVKKAGADYGTPASLAVGTGPYQFKEWRTGQRIILEKNPNYWKPNLPVEEKLVFRFISDPAARLAELRAGAIDFTVDLTPEQLAEINRDPNLEAVLRPSFNVGYLALNPSYQPLSQEKVRQAIAMAINRQDIVAAFWGKLGTTDSHFLPPALDWARSSNIKDYEYNPKRAKELLAKAGYPNGFDLELWYMPVSRPYYPNPKPIAEALAAELSDIGIRVSLKTKDWAAYLEDRHRVPGFQAFMLGWTGDYGDPDNFYYPHFGPTGTSDLGNWKDERLLQLLEQGRQIQNQQERAKIYSQVDEIIYKAILRIPIVHSQPLLGKRTNIKGWQPSPLDSESFETVDKF